MFSKMLKDLLLIDFIVGVVKVNFELFMEGINEFIVFLVFDEFLNVRLYIDVIVKLFFEFVKIVLVEIFLSCVFVFRDDLLNVVEVRFKSVDSVIDIVL